MKLRHWLTLRLVFLGGICLIFVSYCSLSTSRTATAAQFDNRESTFTFETYKGPKPAVAQDATPEPSQVLEIVGLILDEKASDKTRSQAIADNPDLAADLITTIVSDMKAGTKEESHRIPWIWQIAIQAGRSNDTEQIGRVLDVSLPAEDESLAGWQAVVVGGGIVNGLSQQDIWPEERIAEILADDTLLQARWRRTLRLADRMVVDRSVPTGTRYDALRLIAMDSWENSQPVLSEYLVKGTEAELQMGAVSGLVDVPRADAAEMLLAALDGLAQGNRELAIAGLLRGERRTSLLLEAVEAGTVKPDWLNEKQINALRAHESESIKKKAERLFPVASVNRNGRNTQSAPSLCKRGSFQRRMAESGSIAGLLRNSFARLQSDRSQFAQIFQFEFNRQRGRRENLQ